MMYRYLLITLVCLTTPAIAEDLERSNITSCAYQAGTAFEIQKIRQSETDNWAEFERNIKQIYKDTQGRQDLLSIAERVFIQPSTESPDAIHELMFNACVARQQGTEPKV